MPQNICGNCFLAIILNTNKNGKKSAPKSYICEIVGLIFPYFILILDRSIEKADR